MIQIASQTRPRSREIPARDPVKSAPEITRNCCPSSSEITAHDHAKHARCEAMTGVLNWTVTQLFLMALVAGGILAAFAILIPS